MKIAYFSLTGNNVKFLKKTNIDHSELVCIKPDLNLKMEEDFILLTSTIGIGEIPEIVIDFLNYEDNHKHLKGVVGSGNKNWGIRYCLAAKNIAKMYNVENIFNFELAGNQHDVEKFLEIYNQLKENHE